MLDIADQTSLRKRQGLKYGSKTKNLIRANKCFSSQKLLQETRKWENFLCAKDWLEEEVQKKKTWEINNLFKKLKFASMQKIFRVAKLTTVHLYGFTNPIEFKNVKWIERLRSDSGSVSSKRLDLVHALDCRLSLNFKFSVWILRVCFPPYLKAHNQNNNWKFWRYK